MRTPDRIDLRLPRLVLMGISVLATALPVRAELESSKPASVPPAESTARESRALRVVVRPTASLIPATPAVPEEAERLLQRYRAQQAAALREVIGGLQTLQERYAVQGRRPESVAIAGRVAELQQQLAACTSAMGGGTTTVGAQGDPGSLVGFRDRVGQSFLFDLVGSGEQGWIWGGEDGVYTDDSPLALAAVHAGVLRAGERGVVRVDVLPGRDSYAGCTKNGITSSSYKTWQGSYRVSPGNLPINTAGPSLREYREQNGKTLTLEVVGDAKAGTIWGGDYGIYTDDSSLAAAAVHAGILQNGKRGQVRVTILPGRDSYPAISRNGVESSSYGAWGGSFSVEAVEGASVPGTIRLWTPSRIDIRPGGTGNPYAIPGATAAPGVLPSPRGGPYAIPSPAPEEPLNLSSFRGKENTIVLVQVTGTTEGSVWGSDVYTDDSSVAAAAVHAGLLKPGEKGTLRVTILPGRAEYSRCERNGVTSRTYGGWGGSFSLEKVNVDTGRNLRIYRLGQEEKMLPLLNYGAAFDRLK
jgi:hypothetical protein